jgi:nitrate reductase gamma subunit
MSETEFLQLVRGPMLQGATVIFLLGLVARVFQILLLGRKANLAEARGSAVAGGVRTVFSRSVPDAGTFRRSTFTTVAGYIFHIGLAITILLYAPHILLIDEVLGVRWPALPTPVIDAATVVTIITLLAVLVHRLMDPVLRFLSGFQDYLVWFVTILPLVTGYMAFHRIGFSPTMLLALHILSVQLLMVLFPFTKLAHAVTLFMARYYNGAISGYRGVNS